MLTANTGLGRHCPRAARSPEPNGPHLLIGNVQVLAQQIDDMEASLPVFAKKIQEILALHHGHLGIVEEFGRNLMVGSGKGSTQTEHFTGRSNVQGKALAGFRADGEFSASFAEDEDASRRLSFAEQHGVPRASDFGFHVIKRGQHVGRQIAKDPVRAQGTFEAILLYRALHSS